MRAIVSTVTGAADVLNLVERADPAPGRDEVLVRIAVSGVNPTDWKSRRGSGPGQRLAFPEVVPNQDGAGTVVAVGADVDPGRVGERVWVWEAAWQRADGTAQELVALPASHAVPLPDGRSGPGGRRDRTAAAPVPPRTGRRCARGCRGQGGGQGLELATYG
jgi:NADPH2:quinone reductase